MKNKEITKSEGDVKVMSSMLFGIKILGLATLISVGIVIVVYTIGF